LIQHAKLVPLMDAGISISMIRLGIDLGLISGIDPYVLNALFGKVFTGHLCHYGLAGTSAEEDRGILIHTFFEECVNKTN